MRSQIFKAISTKKDIKFTDTFSSKHFFGHSWKLVVVVLCIYNHGQEHQQVTNVEFPSLAHCVHRYFQIISSDGG